MKKIFNFGKVDFNETGRRINELSVQVELRENKDSKPVFSAVCYVWNASHTSTICSGQCFDEFMYYLKNNQLFCEIYDLWKRYHLNDTHRGTQEQMAFLEEHKAEMQGAGYYAELELLRRYGKEKAADGTQFGSVWYYWPIPDGDLERIERLLTK